MKRWEKKYFLKKDQYQNMFLSVGLKSKDCSTTKTKCLTKLISNNVKNITLLKYNLIIQ